MFTMSLSQAFCQNGVSFAQVPISKEEYANKEELKMDDKAQRRDPAPEIGKTVKKESVPEKIILNRKRIDEKRKRSRETQLNRELGIVDMKGDSKKEAQIYTLNDCMEIAIENHLPLQIAKKSMKLAEMRLFEARRNLLPTATLAWEESVGKISGRYYTGKKEYVEGQQPLFRGGELYFTMKQAEVNLEVMKNDHNRISNELVLQVKKAYYTLAKSKENLILQKELSKEVEKILDMLTKQADAGIAPKLEVLNVASQASQARYQLVSAEGDVSVAELILKQAMNIDSKEKIDVADSEVKFKKIKIDFENALNAAMMNRPDLKVNTLMFEYYRYGTRIAKAKGWPKIDLLGSWGLAKEEFLSRDMADTDADQELKPQWYVGVKTSMPFWGSTGEYSLTKEEWVPVVSTTRGTAATTNSVKLKILDKLDYYSGKQLAEIDFDRSRQELNKVKQDIALEIKESCFNYEKALVQWETASNKVKYQEKDLELVRLKRGFDEAQDSNVIDSMIRLAQEKFGYVQAIADCHIAVATLNKAIGVEDYFRDESELKMRGILK
ncbi:MAG: hypothetical protein A2987_02680 [Omnitrophica bacterium RIFCSPLOWO2_01_FULL_45_10]|nr:MAG: hypothetical protein A2987_02680 [Omnitrophica bacterium RIFCSPLOWO2_01_FULL_45_10]